MPFGGKNKIMITEEEEEDEDEDEEDQEDQEDEEDQEEEEEEEEEQGWGKEATDDDDGMDSDDENEGGQGGNESSDSSSSSSIVSQKQKKHKANATEEEEDDEEEGEEEVASLVVQKLAPAPAPELLPNWQRVRSPFWSAANPSYSYFNSVTRETMLVAPLALSFQSPQSLLARSSSSTSPRLSVKQGRIAGLVRVNLPARALEKDATTGDLVPLVMGPPPARPVPPPLPAGCEHGIFLTKPALDATVDIESSGEFNFSSFCCLRPRAPWAPIIISVSLIAHLHLPTSPPRNHFAFSPFLTSGEKLQCGLVEKDLQGPKQV